MKKPSGKYTPNLTLLDFHRHLTLQRVVATELQASSEKKFGAQAITMKCQALSFDQKTPI